jgi:hypothetical protein
LPAPRDLIAIGDLLLDRTLPEPVPGTRLCRREDQSSESKFVCSRNQRTSDRLTEVSVARLELASQQSIAAFVQPWDEPLLINNAGIICGGYRLQRVPEEGCPPTTVWAKRSGETGLVRVVQMERLMTVEFGPSRSKRFGRSLAEARSRAGECSEIEPGRYRARFVLGTDSAAYTGLARLLERVRHWRATDVYEGDEPVSAYQAKEMAWCASSQLKSHGACRFRFFYGVFPRCSVCPLFDGERANRDVLRENPPTGIVLEITFDPNLRALLAGELLPNLDSGFEVPDFPPEEWGEHAGEEPSG